MISISKTLQKIWATSQSHPRNVPFCASTHSEVFRVEQCHCCLEVREVCHRLYHPHQLGWRRGSLSQSRLRCPPGGLLQVWFYTTVKKGRADEQRVKSDLSTIQTQVSLCSLFSCPACHISMFCQGSMCHIQTHESLTREDQMTNTHRVMHSPFCVDRPLKWLHAGRWSVGPGRLLWTENRCSCRQRRRNVSPARWIKKTSKSTSDVLFTCSYIITPVTQNPLFCKNGLHCLLSNSSNITPVGWCLLYKVI